MRPRPFRCTTCWLTALSGPSTPSSRQGSVRPSDGATRRQLSGAAVQSLVQNGGLEEQLVRKPRIGANSTSRKSTRPRMRTDPNPPGGCLDPVPWSRPRVAPQEHWAWRQPLLGNALGVRSDRMAAVSPCLLGPPSAKAMAATPKNMCLQLLVAVFTALNSIPSACPGPERGPAASRVCRPAGRRVARIVGGSRVPQSRRRATRRARGSMSDRAKLRVAATVLLCSLLLHGALVGPHSTPSAARRLAGDGPGHLPSSVEWGRGAGRSQWQHFLRGDPGAISHQLTYDRRSSWRSRSPRS